MELSQLWEKRKERVRDEFSHHGLSCQNKKEVNIFNIGSEDTISATEIGKIVVEEMGLSDVEFTYTGGSRGWKGDVPRMRLGIEKLKAIGWKPEYTSERSVRETARAVIDKR